MSKACAYYPRYVAFKNYFSLFERAIELVKIYPKVKLNSENDSLTSKMLEYLSLNFYVCMSSLVCQNNTIIPTEHREKLQ